MILERVCYQTYDRIHAAGHALSQLGTFTRIYDHQNQPCSVLRGRNNHPHIRGNNPEVDSLPNPISIDIAEPS